MQSLSPVVILSGPSGAGKNEVGKVIRSSSGPVFHFAVSATTRQPRVGKETHGKDYYFLETHDFMSRVAQRHFLEYEKVGPDWYGTLKSEVFGAKEGTIPLIEIDVKGHERLRQHPDLRGRILSFFIDAPDMETLERRLRGRNDGMPEEKIQARLARSHEERTYAAQYDHTVINRVVSDAAEEILSMIRSRVV